MGRTLQIICGVVLAAGLLGAAQQREEGAPNNSDRSQQQQTSPGVAASPPPPYRAYPQRNSDACYNAQDHNAADLCAQWRAAIAAEKAAREARIATIAAIIGTVLGLVTVVGLIVTIIQTHGALGEARRGNRLNLLFERRSRRESRKASEDQERALSIADKSAEAAAGHVGIARETAEHQLRAYIGIPQIDAVDEEERFLVRVHVKNFGQTPARNIRLSSTAVYGLANKPHTVCHALPATILMPNDTRHLSFMFDGSDAEMNAIREGYGGIAIEIKGSFTDAFDRHRTLRCVMNYQHASNSFTPNEYEAD